MVNEIAIGRLPDQAVSIINESVASRLDRLLNNMMYCSITGAYILQKAIV